MPNPPAPRTTPGPSPKPQATPTQAPKSASASVRRAAASARTASNTSINPEFLERYQIELQKNPRSRVFAPLAEAYRKMGMIPEALRICRVGVGANPDFSGGLVAYGKLLIETAKFEDALTLLKKATVISPDNLLAHMLMGDALLELRKPKEALAAFKMVLFLNPEDEKAKSTVRKWEFLTADEFDDEEFAMRPLFDSSDAQPIRLGAKAEVDIENVSRKHAKELERALSLADAFTVRNDLPAAIEMLERAERTLGKSTDITNRLAMLARRTQVLVTADSTGDVSSESVVEAPRPHLNRNASQVETRPKSESETGPKTEARALAKPRTDLQSRINKVQQELKRENDPRFSNHVDRGSTKDFASHAGGKVASPFANAQTKTRESANILRTQRRVAKLETLLHRISERRLD